MARVNAFARVRNENREVGVGGRGANNWVQTTLNTDNASHSNCAVSVTAEVVGNGRNYVERRAGGDQRKSVFTIELPEQNDEFCEVEIVTHNHELRQLVNMGAMLVALKGASEMAQATDKKKFKKGVATIETAGRILEDLKSREKDFPKVILPGGVTLAHALACVKIVGDIISGQGGSN